jgi:hypothetical protein
MSQSIDKKLWKEICLKVTGKDHIDETDERYDFVEAHYKTETESPIEPSFSPERNRYLIAYLLENLQKQEEEEEEYDNLLKQQEEEYEEDDNF